MSTAHAISTAPTPAEVDKKAEQYDALKEKFLQATLAAKEAQVPLDQLKEELIDLVRNFGSAHAEKSKLLHGIKQEIMATFGMQLVYDSAAVERFRLALQGAKQTRVLKKIFVQTIHWNINPEASVIIKGEKLSEPLLALYSQCQVIKAMTPKLQV